MANLILGQKSCLERNEDTTKSQVMKSCRWVKMLICISKKLLAIPEQEAWVVEMIGKAV